MSERTTGEPAPGETAIGEPVRRPLVVACLRHADRHPAVHPLTGQVERDARGSGPPAGEWAALELALRVAQAWDGDVLAVCSGPPDAERTLREAAAVGAGVLRVARPGEPQGGPVDPLEPLEGYLDELAGDGSETAAMLAAAILTVRRPDLVICGDRSVDRGTGSVPAFLAAELDAAQALGLVRLEVEDGGTSPDGGTRGGDLPGLVGERRLDRGRRERLRIPRPAVVSVEAAGLRLRRAGMRDTLAAARMQIPTVRPEGLGSPLHRSPTRPYRPRTHIVPAPSAPSPRERLLALTGALVERTPPTVAHPADAAEAADLLLDYLHRNGYAANPT